MRRSDFADGTTIGIDWSLTSGTIQLNFENDDWVSLPSETGDGGNVPAVLTFTGGQPDVAGQISGPFTGWRGSPRYGAPPILYGRFQGAEAADFLAKFALSAELHLEAAGRDVGSYSLAGSGAGVAALMSCVDRVSSDAQRRLDNDPFRN